MPRFVVAVVLALAPVLSRGAQDGDVFPDMTGSFEVRQRWSGSKGSPAEEGAMAAKLDRLLSILRETPVFNPPRGFHGRVNVGIAPSELAASALPAGCSRRPVSGLLSITLYYISAGREGKPTWGGEANSSFALSVNDPVLPRDPVGDLVLPDGRKIIWEPRETSRIADLPVYEGEWIALRRGGASPWVGVTREQLLRAKIRSLEARIERERRDRAKAKGPSERYQEWLAARGERRKVREQVGASVERRDGPAKAKEWLESAERTEAAMDETMKKLAASPSQPPAPLLEMPGKALADLRRSLESMPPPEGASDAWLSTAPSGGNPYRGPELVPARAPRSRRAVVLAPDLFDCARSRDDIQLVTMHFDFTVDPARSRLPSDRRLEELMKTGRWGAVASMVE